MTGGGNTGGRPASNHEVEDVAEDKATRRADRQRGRNPIRVYGQERDQVDTDKLVRVLLALVRQENNDQSSESAKQNETP
jgi:hypothetical protein